MFLLDDVLVNLVKLPLESVILVQGQVAQIGRDAQITFNPGIVIYPLVLVSCHPELDEPGFVHYWSKGWFRK